MLRRFLFSLLRPIFKRLYGSPMARALWLVPGSRRLYLGLIGHTRPDQVSVRGHDLQLDALDSMMLSVNEAYEDLELDIFRRCIREGETVIDVGAHIGLYTLEAARAVGATGRVLAFEPATPNFELLRANVTRNKYDNVELFHAAVAAGSGTAFLNHSNENTGDHRLVTRSDQPDAEAIETVSIDEVLAARSISEVSVVKMDIQGAEPVALRGAQRIMSASENLVLFTEVSPAHLESWGGASNYIDQLGSFGFEFFRIDEDAKRVEPVDLADVNVEPRLDAREEHANLVCVKGVEARDRVLGREVGR